MAERSRGDGSPLCWVRVDASGGGDCVPRGWLDELPGLRPYLIAGVALDSGCAFLWNGPGGRLLRLEITQRATLAGVSAAETTAVEIEPPFGLTWRELEVLTLVAGGLNNPDIAGRLGTTRRTVATHVEHLLTKLDAPTRAAAAAVAGGEGLLVLPLPGGPHGLVRTPVQQPALRLADRDRPRRAHRPLRKAPIVIGGIYPSHGPAATDGAVRRKATELAIAELNNQGGIAGRPVRHLTAETDITDRDALADSLYELVERCPDAITLGYTLAARDDFATVFAAPALHGRTGTARLPRAAHRDVSLRAPPGDGGTHPVRERLPGLCARGPLRARVHPHARRAVRPGPLGSDQPAVAGHRLARSQPDHLHPARRRARRALRVAAHRGTDGLPAPRLDLGTDPDRTARAGGGHGGDLAAGRTR